MRIRSRSLIARIEFQKTRSTFHPHAHNETLSVAAMCVRIQICSPAAGTSPWVRLLARLPRIARARAGKILIAGSDCA